MKRRHEELLTRQCQRPGRGKRCANKDRFCSAKCEEADRRDARADKIAGLKKRGYKRCPQCKAKFD